MREPHSGDCGVLKRHDKFKEKIASPLLKIYYYNARS
jgi:hypothetical protein